MRFIRSYIFAALALASSAIAYAREVAAVAVLYALELFRPEPQAFAMASGYGDMPMRGEPLSLALQNSMRHEARVSRRSAARNI